jgi:hypothetical protein
VTVNVQQRVVVDFVLTPGEMAQTVSVTGEAPLLQSQDAEVGQVNGARTINNLPLNGRNFTFRAQLSAGVTFDQQDTRGLGASGSFAANGLRPAQNNYLLDGIDDKVNLVDFLNGTAFVVKPPVDAIAEFKIQTNNYSAEAGRSAGAILHATIKSGTNEFHGNAWEFLRNDALDAANFFENSGGLQKGEYRQNQFGYFLEFISASVGKRRDLCLATTTCPTELTAILAGRPDAFAQCPTEKLLTFTRIELT